MTPAEPKQGLEPPMPPDMAQRPSPGPPGAPAAPRRGLNILAVAAVVAEIAVLSATATVAWGLVAGAGNPFVWGPMVVALTAVELTRLPLIMRAPKLSLAGACCALVLAGGVSLLTMETLILGTESVLTARASGVTAAETVLSQATTAFDAAKATEARREGERAKLAGVVNEAQRHAEEIGREPVALQNNTAVSAYRRGKSWIAPGTSAANTVAAANAKAQAEHAARSAAAEASLAAARAAAAALPPIEITSAEAAVVAARQSVERERAASPMHRLGAALFRTDTANLKAEDYEWLRRTVAVSVGAILAFATLAAGLVSELPDRGERRPSKLSRALRAWLARRRRPIYRDVPGPVQFRDRTIFKYVATDPVSGRVLDPDSPT